MKYEDAKAIFLLEHCAERCDGYQKDDACDNCEINAAIEALEKQIPFIPETNNLKVGLGRCKCGAEFLDKLTNYCGNCGQRLLWEVEEWQRD